VRVFLDTNVLVSAFATRGLCADVVRVVVDQHELLVGEVVLEELMRVLTTRFRMPRDQAQSVEAWLRQFEVVARPRRRDPIKVRDDADRWVLASAHAAKADVLITGDDDLLAVAAQATMRILTPRQFWSDLRR
jgi:putative PIN family toxin of toxin-antitoxin system